MVPLEWMADWVVVPFVTIMSCLVGYAVTEGDEIQGSDISTKEGTKHAGCFWWPVRIFCCFLAIIPVHFFMQMLASVLNLDMGDIGAGGFYGPPEWWSKTWYVVLAIT